jgi:hypothetical protein
VSTRTPTGLEESREMHTDQYVGYRALSTQQRRSLMVLVPALLAVVAFIALFVAIAQRDPGAGVWDQRVVERLGTIQSSPVPMLWIDDASGAQRPVLLVEEGKYGALERCTAVDGKRVIVRGTTLTRGDTMIVELSAGESGLSVSDATAAEVPTLVVGERTTLRGELVDAKCYAGAMKPGDRKAHKACATLCVSNGIPAMLVVRAAGKTEAYVCLAAAGESLDADTLSKIGEPIEVTGVTGMLGSLRTITIEPGTVKRR